MTKLSFIICNFIMFSLFGVFLYIDLNDVLLKIIIIILTLVFVIFTIIIKINDKKIILHYIYNFIIFTIYSFEFFLMNLSWQSHFNVNIPYINEIYIIISIFIVIYGLFFVSKKHLQFSTKIKEHKNQIFIVAIGSLILNKFLSMSSRIFQDYYLIIVLVLFSLMFLYGAVTQIRKIYFIIKDK